MSKVYNTQGDISTNLFAFLHNLTHFSKPILKNLSKIIVAMLYAESCITHDIAKNIKDDSNILLDSIIKKLKDF